MELSPSRSSSGSRSSCSSRSRGPGPGVFAISALALLAGVVLLPSCTEEDPAGEIDACIEESIAQGRTANWTQGVWRIHGSGERENCSDEALDADELTLDSKPIRVHQQGHYLFLENPELHPGFTLSGLVGDRCIHIKTTEKTGHGETIRYDLPARFVGSSTFSGDFRSSGPGRCEGKGDFSVSVKLDPVPATPETPAPADAGVPVSELCASCARGCSDLEAEYVEDCKESCERYICRIGIDAGHDADASATDATDDVPDAADDAPDAADDAPDAADDAPDDGANDAGDAPSDSPEDAGEAGEADSGADAGPDAGQPDSSGPVYVLWDGAVEIDEEAVEDAAKGACTVSAGLGSGHAGSWLVAALACLGLHWRRRKTVR